jgi:hypothetical protein
VSWLLLQGPIAVHHTHVVINAYFRLIFIHPSCLSTSARKPFSGLSTLLSVLLPHLNIDFSPLFPERRDLFGRKLLQHGTGVINIGLGCRLENGRTRRTFEDGQPFYDQADTCPLFWFANGWSQDAGDILDAHKGELWGCSVTL